MVGASSFSQPYFTTTLAISVKTQFLNFSQFLPPYSTLTCSQNHPYNTPFLYTSAISHLPIFS